MEQIGLLDETKAYENLGSQGDRLVWLSDIIDWGMFAPALAKAKPNNTSAKKGGRPPISPLLMFKMVILQEMHGLSYDQTEFLANDRLSWKRFLGFTLSDKAPDATTLWLFREALKNSGVYDELFLLFNNEMQRLGVITHKGSIIDASFVDAPRQRNTREENKTIKEGGVPEAWKAEDQAHKLSQKDTDAAWAKKNNETHYGYKDHVVCDVDSKMIVDFEVTPANVHDSQVFIPFAEGYMNELWADSAYACRGYYEWYKANFPDLMLHINAKGYVNTPLTDEQKANNRENSRIRSRVEHIFGYMTGSMGGMIVRSIGLARAECAIALKNLVYNISRYATIRKLTLKPATI